MTQPDVGLPRRQNSLQWPATLALTQGLILVMYLSLAFIPWVVYASPPRWSDPVPWDYTRGWIGMFVLLGPLLSLAILVSYPVAWMYRSVIRMGIDVEKLTPGQETMLKWGAFCGVTHILLEWCSPPGLALLKFLLE